MAEDFQEIFAGPFETREDAIKHAIFTWCDTKGGFMLQHGGQFYVNDGIDIETGKPFSGEVVAAWPGILFIL